MRSIQSGRGGKRGDRRLEPRRNWIGRRRGVASRRAARVAPPPNEEAALAAGRIEEELGVDLVAIARPHLRPGRDPFAEKTARHSPVSVLLVPAA